MASGAGRFAPSPSADLHIGNLRTAVLARLFARSTGRRFLMRVEDLDDRTHTDIALPPDLGAVDNGLAATDLPQGQKVSGPIAVDVPQGKNITEIVLINGIGGPQLGQWSVT